MIANIIFTLIGLSIMCIACWIMGYRTCASRSKNEYDRGYVQALKDKEQEELLDRDDMLNQIWKEQQGKQLLTEMEELFEEDKDIIIDGGYY